MAESLFLKLRVSRGVLAGVAALFGLGVTQPAKSLPLQGSQALVMTYSVDSSLAYIDALQKSPIAANTGPMLADDVGNATSEESQPRVLGLKRLRALLEWRAGASTTFKLVLRPDAVNRQMEAGADSIPREFDARSGDSGMKPLPTIRLLDAYQLTTYISPNLNVGAGVWEGFVARGSAYRELLGFGLDVVLPAKFAAVAMEWQTGAPSLPTAASPSPGLLPPEVSVGLFYFLGDLDRGEAMNGHRGSYDRAATSQDPYQGGATTLTWRPSSAWTIGLLAGYFESATNGTGYDSTFAQASINGVFSAAGQNHRVSIDSRLEKDHGRGGVESQNLLSGSAKLAWAFNEDTAALAGIHLGRGDRWADFASGRSATVGLDGYQLEGGASTTLGSNLSLRFLISREFRTMTSAGQRAGGFRDREGAKSFIHRVGVELAYLLDANT